MSGFTTRPTLQGSFGMAASTHWLATGTAMSVLERGGNAADAAVAAGFVLHVAEPHLNGPAGEVPLIIATAGQTPRVLCGQGVAPAAANAATYRDLGLDLVPGTGPLAAAVPGAFDAWMLLLRDYGTWRLADVLDHAIGLAERGCPVLPGVAATVTAVAEQFRTHWPSSAELWLDPEPPRPGTPYRNPALAATWRRLLAEVEAATGDRDDQLDAARRCWREGFIGEALVAAAGRPTMDSSGTEHAGLLTGDDLVRWQATWESTVSQGLGEWTLHKTGPWGQGPTAAAQLGLLEPGDYESFDAAAVHRLIEGTKLTLADRDAWYGDALPVPLETLLSPEHQVTRRAMIGDTADPGFRPSALAGYPPHLAAHIRRVIDGTAAGPRTVGAGEPTVGTAAGPTPIDGGAAGITPDGVTRGDTCHLDVVDRWGTLISATPSGGWLQSNPTIPELGFCLGTRLQMTWLDDGLTNTLTGGRRPRTTLSPALASYQGEPVLAFGTPGGDQQDQWGTHLFLRIVAGYDATGELDLQGAIDAPNWHTDSVINSFWPREFVANRVVVEPRIGDEVIAGLRRRGHDVVLGSDWSEGRLSAVAIHPETRLLHGAANPRGMAGYAAGR